MPLVIIPNPTVLAGELVSSILNATRMRLHERMPSLIAFSGTVLKETEPSTQQAANNAYRKLQAVMANAGSSTFEASLTIFGIPPVSSSAMDPATECWLGLNGCFDGAVQFPTPTLPPDLMTPLWMSQRWHGSMQQFSDYRRPSLPFLVDGLPKCIKTNWNPGAQWRGELVYYPGATVAMDFLLYYQKWLPDIVDVGTTPWFESSVPIIRCQEPFSYWLCREFCMSQSNNPELDADVRQQYILGAASFEDQALKATRLLVSPDKKRKQRINVSRLPFAGGGSGGGFSGNSGIPAFTGS